MKLELIINGRDEMRAAAEFMATLTAIRYPEQAAEAVAEAKAEVAIETAKTRSRKPKPEEPAAPVAASPEEPISAAEAKTSEPQVATAPTEQTSELIDPAELQKIASAKSKLVGAEKVRDTIAGFGAASIRLVSADSLPKLKAALESL